MLRTARGVYWSTREWLWPRYVRMRRRCGSFERMRRRESGGVRILTYHGVCRDGDQHQPWIPHYFVSQTRLDQHLTWLKSCGEVISLGEAWRRLRDGEDKALSYVVTFDDGYHNNLSLAAPILQAHGVTATLFLVTGAVQSSPLVPTWIQARFLAWLRSRDPRFLPGTEYDETIRQALDLRLALPRDVAPHLVALWRQAEARLEPNVIEDVRYLSIRELPAVLQSGFELGAHTVTHPHLARMSGTARRREVEESVQQVRKWAAEREIFFAYPNGRVVDFGEPDIEALRAVGVAAAVTTVPGVNLPGVDPYRLFRLPVSRRATRDDFTAMASGIYDPNRWMQPP